MPQLLFVLAIATTRRATTAAAAAASFSFAGRTAPRTTRRRYGKRGTAFATSVSAPRPPLPLPLLRSSSSSSVGGTKKKTTADSEQQQSYRWECPDHKDVCHETGVTLSRYMMEIARYNPSGSHNLDDVESIFTAIQTATKTISSIVRRSSLRGTTGFEGGGGSLNVHGEEQKKLDVITNDVLKKTLSWSGRLATLASEEEDAPVMVDNMGREVFSSDVVLEQEGDFVAVFDPLDGSSNVDANIPTGTLSGAFYACVHSNLYRFSVQLTLIDFVVARSPSSLHQRKGTIFGIYKASEECIIDFDASMDENEYRCLQNALQPGNNLVAAGYCLYSSATTLVFTLGSGVNGFTLDETIGEYVLTHPDIRIPDRGKIYSFNEANRWDWDQPLQDYITDIQKGLGDTKSRYTSRYIGSMVADVHRTLLYGGIFGYPSDKKNRDGKLRLLYEAAPMSFLVEQAGGLALTGKNRIMDIIPQSVHQRVPCILGSPDDVSELRRYYESSNDPELIARCEARLRGVSLEVAAE